MHRYRDIILSCEEIPAVRHQDKRSYYSLFTPLLHPPTRVRARVRMQSTYISECLMYSKLYENM
jgi:hypothetical protein